MSGHTRSTADARSEPWDLPTGRDSSAIWQKETSFTFAPIRLSLEFKFLCWRFGQRRAFEDHASSLKANGWLETMLIGAAIEVNPKLRIRQRSNIYEMQSWTVI